MANRVEIVLTLEGQTSIKKDRKMFVITSYIGQFSVNNQIRRLWPHAAGRGARRAVPPGVGKAKEKGARRGARRRARDEGRGDWRRLFEFSRRYGTARLAFNAK